MLKVRIGGKVDTQKIQRLARNDEILVGYPSGVVHPVYVGHKTTKSGKKGKRAFSALLSNEDNATLARKLHFGDSKIPARPFLYLAITKNRGEIKRRIRAMLQKRKEEGREPTGEFSVAGIAAFIVGAVQQFVRGDYFKAVTPNSPMTIRMKGSDTPLIDTGFMINSTTFITKKQLPKFLERAVEAKGENQ